MIDAVATRPHYWAHLRPVLAALPPERRGRLYTGTTRPDPSWGTDGFEVTTGRPGPGPDPVLCAAGNDLADCFPRPVVLFEHGAGQSYLGTTDAAYAGGEGRDAVRLFLAPREDVAARDRNVYPDAEALAVGCPRLDRLVADYGTPRVSGRGRPVVGITWHFDALVQDAPEAGTAYPHYGPETLRELAAAGPIVGHSHPRARAHIEPEYDAFGIPYARQFERVLQAADVIVADNSSVLWEAVACNRPVVFLDAPWYRADVEHGLRFWEWADIGPRVSDRSELVAAIDDALDPRWETARHEARHAIYANLGAATRPAVDEILKRWA